MGHLEPLTGALRAAEQHRTGRRIGENGIQPPGCLLLDEQGPLRFLVLPVKQPPPFAVRQGACGEVFHHHGVERQAALLQPLPGKELQKAAPAGKPGQVRLQFLPRRQQQLGRQSRVRPAAGHVVLEVGVELFVFSVCLRQVGQHHTVPLEGVQVKPLEEFQQWQPRRGPLDPCFDGDTDAVQLPLLAGGQLGPQAPLGRLFQIVFKFLPGHHQSQHVLQIAVGAQPLMAVVVQIEQ